MSANREKRVKGARTTHTYRQAAALRELAGLGVWQTKAAEMIHTSVSRVCQISGEFNFKFPKKPTGQTPLMLAIKDGYERGLSPAKISEITGAPQGSVKARASQMGLTATSTRDPGKHKRGFGVPAERMAEYRSLRKLGMTFKECGYVMGLLKRPSVRTHSPIPQHSDMEA